MKIVCDRCSEKKGTCTTLEDWQSHLISDLHQSRNEYQNSSCKDSREIFYNKWDIDRNEKSIVITHLPQPGNFARIIKEFSKYGFIEDIYFEPTMKFCIIEYDCNSAVSNTVSRTQVINGKKLHVQPKSTIMDSDLNYLQELPASENQNFLLNHFKIESKVASMNFKDQLRTFMEMTKTEVENVRLKGHILEDLLKILKPRYPYCLLYPIGSFKTGLFDRDCAFEIQYDPCGLLKAPNRNIGQPPPPVPQEAFSLSYSKICHGLQTYMEQDRPSFLEVTYDNTVDSESSIGFLHNETGIECLLRFNSVRDVHLSYFILFLQQLDDFVYQFLNFALYWARFHNLHREMNKSITLLCIAYLNQKEIIPSLSRLQSHVRPSPGWNIAYCNDVEYVKKFMKRSRDENDVQKMLAVFLDFFELCSTTDFKKYVLCSNTGELLPRDMFMCGQEYRLPHSMNAYKVWRQSMGPNYFLNVETPLCIQSPFHLGMNDSATVQSDVLDRFQKEACNTAKNIKLILSSSEPNLMKIFEEMKIVSESQTNNYGHTDDTVTCAVGNLMESLSCSSSEVNQPEELHLPPHLVALKKMIRIKPSKKFTDKFNACFGQDEKSEVLTLKRKVLLTSFIWDFLSMVWQRCFYMQAAVEEISETDARFSDFEHQLRGKFLHRYKPRLVLQDQDFRSDLPDNIVNNGRNEDILKYIVQQEDYPCGQAVKKHSKSIEKMKNLPTKIRNNFCRVITVWGLQDIWSGRNKTKKDFSAPTNEFCDPMVEEENLTKQILNSLQIDKESIIRFTCTALVDTRDENPVLYLAMKDACQMPSSQFPQAANYVSLVFGNMVKAYSMFRLNQWLENDVNENVLRLL